MPRNEDLDILRRELAVATISHISAIHELQLALIETTSPVSPQMVQRWKDARKKEESTAALYNRVLEKLQKALAG
jgi:hypothetical protein